MESTAEVVRPVTAKGPPPTNAFQKGNTARLGLPVEPEDESIPELLRDLRHVRSKSPSLDKTPSRRQLRAMAKKEYGKFLAMWKEEERLYAESLRPVESSSGVVDVGSAKCLELIDRLLGEFEGGGR